MLQRRVSGWNYVSATQLGISLLCNCNGYLDLLVLYLYSRLTVINNNGNEMQQKIAQDCYYFKYKSNGRGIASRDVSIITQAIVFSSSCKHFSDKLTKVIKWSVPDPTIKKLEMSDLGTLIDTQHRDRKFSATLPMEWINNHPKCQSFYLKKAEESDENGRRSSKRASEWIKALVELLLCSAVSAHVGSHRSQGGQKKGMRNNKCCLHVNNLRVIKLMNLPQSKNNKYICFMNKTRKFLSCITFCLFLERTYR